MTDVLVANPFEKVTVSPGVLGGAEISWLPKLDLPWPDPWTFRVEVADTPAETWTTVATVASTNWALIDPLRYKYDVLTEVWYRVVLVDGDTEEHESDPVHVGTNLGRRDWILCKEVCRRAGQRMRIRTGREGYLFKRRHWGALCEDCGDEVTGQETNSQCPTCFGVGIVDGYHDGISMTVEMHDEDLQVLTDDTDARRHALKHPTMAVNFPKISPFDLWMDRYSGRIWSVRPHIKTVSALRGISLLVAFQLQPVESTDVVYQLEAPE